MDKGGGGKRGESSTSALKLNPVFRIQEELRLSKEEVSKVEEQMKQLGNRRHDLYKKIKDLKAELELLNEIESGVSQFSRDDFPWSTRMVKLLKSTFKLEDFRSHQKVAVNATMSGLDLILIMPTGGGKSLCFQLPAVLSEGLTLVVSPLISLMEDQLQGMQDLGISTAIFNANTSKDETKLIFDGMSNPESTLKLLYVTPEKLAKSKRLLAQVDKMYRAGRFARLVIDEVHCCSQWGHDFRPDYKFLGIMKTQYPKTPIIGLTATATANVILDVQKILNIEGCLVLRDSFYRANLQYIVIDALTKDKVEDVAELIKTRYRSNECGIIYCLTIKDCEEVSNKLKGHGIKSGHYHAQMEPEKRSSVQQKWYRNDLQVIVATVAFGMGINKLDVRFVIHYSMSKSIENYYQETGRAGRDGDYAECIMFYNFQDVFRASTLMFTERNGVKNVYNMLRYCLEQKLCRKLAIAQHFGDSCDKILNGNCGMCDNCDIAVKGVGGGFRRETVIDAAKLLIDVLKILDQASRLDERMTCLKVMDALYGKGSVKLRVGDVPVPKYDRNVTEKIVGLLLIDGYLAEDFHFTPYSTISYIVPGGNIIKSKSFGDKTDEELKYTLYGRTDVLKLTGKDLKSTKLDGCVKNSSVPSSSKHIKEASKLSNATKRKSENSSSSNGIAVKNKKIRVLKISSDEKSESDEDIVEINSD